MIQIPFNLMTPVGREAEHVQAVLQSGRIGGGGAYAKRCEAHLQELLQGARVLLTSSCTAALEMAALLLELEPGDEVAMPSFTFVSTANAVRLRGAAPRFVDIEPDTLNLDPRALEAAIGSRTRAIWPVHYAGVGCDMDAIGRIASARGLDVVEDAAQALGAGYRGRPLGRFGRLAAFSFHETKNVGCGEGGALVVNDPSLVARAAVLRDKGTNRAEFLQGRVDKYVWVDLGSSFTLSDVSAAYLLGQLERFEEVAARRLALHRAYTGLLGPLEAAGLARLPHAPDDRTPNGHLFYLLLESAEVRRRFIDHLEREGVQAVFHYAPLHLSPMGRALGYAPGDLPVTEDLAARLVRLPLYHALSEAQLHHVAEAVLGFFGLPAPA